MLQIGGVFGGSAGGVLARWEQLGVFSYVLPFLIIFALVFGIMTKTKIFKDSRAINGIIALCVGLLALQFDFVPIFFSEIFPRIGIGLAVILAAMIFLGLFSDPEKGVFTWIFYGIGAIVFLVVIIQSFSYTGSPFGWWIQDNWTDLLATLGFLVVVGIVIGSGKPKSTKQDARGIIFRPDY